MPLQYLIFPSLHALERSSPVVFIKSTRDFLLYTTFHTVFTLSFIWELFFSLHILSHYSTSLDPTGTQLFPCAVVLLIFNRFITNCYIYKNSTVWIILPLSKLPGKIGGVTPVPLKTQSPRQNFLGRIYPSHYLSVYTTIC